MFYKIINDRKNISNHDQYSNIQLNQQIFITAYNICNTVNHLLYGDNYKNILNLTDKNPIIIRAILFFIEINLLNQLQYHLDSMPCMLVFL